jgi:sigma-B regulation protein RsbU (phosphoserine phosphatase)
MPEIRVRPPNGRASRFPVDKERIKIGRSRESDIVLSDIALSRQHAEICRRGEAFFLRDLDSVNGTRLNGERIKTERRLYPGDVIKIADYILTFSEPGDPSTEEATARLGIRAFPAREVTAPATPQALAPEEVARQTRILDILSRAAGALVAHRPFEELIELVLDELLDVTPADRGALVLMEGDPPRPVVKASRSRIGSPITAVSRTIARKVVGERVSLLIPKVFEDAAFAKKESIASAGIRSAMASPLWLTSGPDEEGDVIGLVYVDTCQEGPVFGEEDLRVLTALANLAATRIHTARLLETSQNKRTLTADLERAAQIQSSFLPSCAPSIPGYEIAGEIQSGSAVGADYFDFEEDHGDLVLALGDVAGKGTGAAILMTLLRAAVRAHWTDGAPAEVMPRINRNLEGSVPRNRYATLFLARLTPAEGRLSFVNAGHHPPVLLRKGGAIERLSAGGTVLGMFTDQTFTEGSAQLEHGDLLVVYSDGVAEAANDRGETFGEARLTALVRAHRHQTAAEVLHAVLRALPEHAGPRADHDDWTLVVAKRT